MPLHPKRDLANPVAPMMADEAWYHEFVGQVTNLQKTRGDIAFATLQLSKGLRRQTQEHHDAARDLLLYLRDTADIGNLYGSEPESASLIIGHSDTDFGGNRLDGRAVGGAVIKIKGGLISNRAKTQKAVTWSTFESETIGFSETARNMEKLQY